MQNLLDPAILFFIFGIIAGMVKSNLEIPASISRFLSLYLLMALGLKGGFALALSGLTTTVSVSILVTVLLAIIIPLFGYFILKTLVSDFDAVAIAATYGSVSAVSFVTAIQYLEHHHVSYSGHMAAAMALMESPAIIMAVFFANMLRKKKLSLDIAASNSNKTNVSITKVLHESFTDGAQLLLLGSMVIGFITGDVGKNAMQPFSGDLFKGMLSFFLLDMGLMTARNMSQIRGRSPALIAYAIVGPIIHASLALGLSVIVNLSAGDGTLLMILAASASYIAVPAVLRYAVPEASPSLYFGLSLGVTFPLNIICGIPVYAWVARQVL